LFKQELSVSRRSIYCLSFCEKRCGMRRFLAVILVLLLLCLPVAGWAVPLEEIYDIIETFYVDEVDAEKLRATGPGELGTVLGDPYTVYFTPEEFQLFLEVYYGTYSGIGIIAVQRDEITVVKAVFPGTPAESAGLLPGDIILSVDGKSAAGKSLDHVVSLIRGEPGTTVELELQRGNQILQRSMVRGNIAAPTVYSTLMGDVAYLSLSGFNEQTPDSFRKHLFHLKQFDPRGYILDLRDNPGGSVDAVLQVAAQILPRGPLVSLRDRYGNEEIFINQNGADPLPNLIVLINGSSASSAEILAGAIEDYEAGLLVGEQSFGKASVQTVFLLSDDSGLKVTTARYYTPAGRSINGTGLTPGVIVTADAGQLFKALEIIRSTSPTLVFSIGSGVAWTTEGNLPIDSPPYIEGSRAFVPLRLLAQAAGAEISWNKDSLTATLRTKSTEIKIPVGYTSGLRDGMEFGLLGTAILKEGRVFVPVRAVSGMLGGRIWWNGSKQEVIIAWD
jgi:carboxyl-terminal processing protease